MTFDKEHATAIQKFADEVGWVFSVISGCPLLGQGTYCYLTNYNKLSPAVLVEDMQSIEQQLKERNVPTLRAKVEHIVYDSKTGVNEVG